MSRFDIVLELRLTKLSCAWTENNCKIRNVVICTVYHILLRLLCEKKYDGWSMLHEPERLGMRKKF